MTFQMPSVRLVPWPQARISASALARKTEPSPALGLACRLVQIVLALYLIPAVLIALLVGVVGMMILGVARVLVKLQGRTTS